jgi:hypothetical protein
MTVMQERETRFNFIFSLAFFAIGLAMWCFGLTAQTQGWFLPEYVKTIRGSGGSILLVGLLWLMLTAIRPLPALQNLFYAGLVFILSLLVAMFGSWSPAPYAAYLKKGGLVVLAAGLLWVSLALVKLLASPSQKVTR